jgi:superfamily I DNA and RNA helicase
MEQLPFATGHDLPLKAMPTTWLLMMFKKRAVYVTNPDMMICNTPILKTYNTNISDSTCKFFQHARVQHDDHSYP